jgi:hypothetical protein
MRGELLEGMSKPTPVTVKAPDVTVNPVVKAPAVTVNVDSVRVVSMPRRVHTVTRDLKGKPTGSVESDE